MTYKEEQEVCLPVAKCFLFRDQFHCMCQACSDYVLCNLPISPDRQVVQSSWQSGDQGDLAVQPVNVDVDAIA